MTAVNPQPGDWVLIRAKVLELHPNCVDLGVELFSKTDQYSAFVRRDLCEITEKPIPDEPGDGSVVLVDGDAYQRQGGRWFAVGVEEQHTWRDLNAKGDVEVIHHG